MLHAGKADAGARSQLVFVQAALAQYPMLDAAVAIEGDTNVAHDWNFGAVRREKASPGGAAPALLLIAPGGSVARRWEGFIRPADLGLALKHYLGAAPANAPFSIEGSLP